MISAAVALTAAPAASAATLTVDDDLSDCPSAAFQSVQAAVDAAQAGDIVAICPGSYEEGPATVPNGGANAVNITKMITIRGAGAGKVVIRPKPALASLLGTTTTYRNGTGAVVGVQRSGVRTIVDISGITVEGGTTAVGAGVKFWNSEGSLTASRIRTVAPLTAAQGYGAVVASNLNGDRLGVRISGVELSGYAKAGVVLDSTQQAPAQGVLAVTIQGNTLTGAGPQAVATQQGVLASGLVSGTISGNVITGHRLDDLDPATTTDDVSSAGVRLVDLDLTPVSSTNTNTRLTATGNTISGNGFGARNETGAGADQPTPFTATGNYWGAATGPSLGLPRGAGDPVNGAAINFTGFRTTPIAVPAVPGATADAAPTGELDAPTADLVVRPGTPYTLRAIADDDFGVRSVAFAAGSTDLGADATAPYAAPVDWTPDAALDGQNAVLTVTITDSSGQVTTSIVTVAVRKPAPATGGGTTKPPVNAKPPASAPPVTTPRLPTRVTLRARARHKRKLILSGTIGLPAGTPCPAGSTVRLTVYLGGKRLVRRAVVVDGGCAYRLVVKLPTRAARRTVTVKARYEGGGPLLARIAPSRTVAVKR